VGYLAQGGAKFAGYELWKKKFVEIAGDQETAVKYRTVIYLGAASVAEYALNIYVYFLCCDIDQIGQILCRYPFDTFRGNSYPYGITKGLCYGLD
jgi:hypothetical protein